MSPAPRLKPKDKKAGCKHFSKPPSHGNTTTTTTGVTRDNPLSGMFNTFDMLIVPPASPIDGNDCFQNIDNGDDNTSATGADYDSISNNGSWSGESEDHKAKPSHSVPELNSKRREKIREKNEKKHKRQKERRAKELHEQCSKLLVLRKLESLAAQLVDMGFPHERSKVALIRNGGRVEESVGWLLESTEEDGHWEPNLENLAKLKIDVSEELARIRDMEIRHMASKQEVERILVSCEGDLEKAEETFKLQKMDMPSVPSKSNELQNPKRAAVAASSPLIQQKIGKKVPKVGPDNGAKTRHMLRRTVPKSSDATRPPVTVVPTGKEYIPPGSDTLTSASASVPVSLALSMQSRLPLEIENSLMNLQLGSVKPVGKPVPNVCLGSSPPGMTSGWYVKPLEMVTPNWILPPVPVSRSLACSSILDPNLQYNRLHPPRIFNNGAMDDYSARIARGNGLFSREGGKSFPAFSLGLFSGRASRSLPPVDWNTVGGSTAQFDYTEVDWSMDRGLLSSSRTAGMWTNNGCAAFSYNPNGYGPNRMSGGGRSSLVEERVLFDTPRWLDSLPPF